MRSFSLFGCLLVVISCSDSENSPATLSVISSTIDGITFGERLSDVAIEPEIAITFSAAVNPDRVREVMTFNDQNGTRVDAQLTFGSANSRVSVRSKLEYSQDYMLSIPAQSIGNNGEILDRALVLSFTTNDRNGTTSLEPCRSTSGDCLRSRTFSGDNGIGTFTYFSNYPVYNENVVYEEITNAIILVHGFNRNADDYFEWMTATLADLSLEESTLLIAPFFKISEESTNNEFYWTTTSWRDGRNSSDATGISSFTVTDSLLFRLSNASLFPVLDHIIVTGHSSGGLFTHSYAAANKYEDDVTPANVYYITANSQYFYYPTDERINGSDNRPFTPSTCNGYNFWPLGFNFVPDYLNGSSADQVNGQFIARQVIYLLGDENDSDPTLNTTDCDATLLGATRFERGENIFTIMNGTFPGNNHSKTIVQGIGHDGRRMYQSDEFKSLLTTLLN